MSDTRPRRRRLPSPEVRRMVAVAAATEAFAEHGFQRATMDDIADRAALPKPSLYESFPSKDELFVAAVTASCDGLVDHLVLAYARAIDLPPLERMKAGIAAFFEFAEEQHAQFRLVFSSSNQGPGAVQELVAATLARINAEVATTLRREFDRYGTPAQVAPALFAQAIVGMTTSTAVAALEAGWSTDAVVDVLAEYATAGLFGVQRRTVAALADADAELGQPSA